MRTRTRLAAMVLPALAFTGLSFPVLAQAPLDTARELLRAGNASEAYQELARVQREFSGQAEFDYLLGVAALDSGRTDEAIIAFERVLALMPNHAGARMDLARAYYASGAYDLAEAAFLKLRDANPPPAAQQAISRYLEAIQARKRQTQAGWAGYGELGLGWDSNITAVPSNFGAAAQQAFNLIDIQPTGNAVKRHAPFAQGALGLDYTQPLSAGWSAFAGGELRGRAYRHEPHFNTAQGDLHAGGALNAGANQYRVTASFLEFDQEGEAPGDPKPTNDRRMGGLGFDVRHALSPRTQLGASLQVNRVRFPDNRVEDFDQAYASVSWLHSFERRGVPLLYLTAFASNDRAPNRILPDEDTTKSKRLFGARSYYQYSLSPKVHLFNGLAVIHRRDTDAFARSTQVEHGRDTYFESTLGVAWQFRDACALRLQYAYSRNASNIDIFDYNRHEISSTIRCDLF
ncbi:MAG TPA: tetratricopeptide repeat protein [Usitatibacter sp.]|nr:tetratricopeptide repeat protein [Usitatibacter sp.]